MQSSVIIEGVSRQEFMAYMESIKSLVENKVQRSEYTTRELCEITGYSRSHLRVMIKRLCIPFERRGNEIVVAQKYLSKFKTKK
jgi:hypothetical protein